MTHPPIRIQHGHTASPTLDHSPNSLLTITLTSTPTTTPLVSCNAEDCLHSIACAFLFSLS